MAWTREQMAQRAAQELEDGFYVKPEVKEEKEFRKGTFGGKNKEVMGYESDDFEEVEDPKAEMDAHIIPAQLYLKE